MKKIRFYGVIAGIVILQASHALAVSKAMEESVYDPGKLRPRDSILRVTVGSEAADFTLPAVSGGTISMKQYRGKKNVVISFVPAAWTPVCSDQWPGYNIAKSLFEKNDAVLLGITVDNIPTLYAWTQEMGTLWFPVLSDFWPHGKIADQFGVLRSDGMSERALFIIDKKGIISYIDVHDINDRPSLGDIARELENLEN